MAAIVVVIQKLTTGTEADRLLEQLEQAIGMAGEAVAGDGRGYHLAGAVTWDEAIAGLEAVLGRVSPTWSIHLGFRRPD